MQYPLLQVVIAVNRAKGWSIYARISYAEDGGSFDLIDFWNGEKFIKGQPWFPKGKLKNWNGRNITASAFDVPPYR